MPGRELTTKQNMLWNSVGSLVYMGCQWLMTILVVRLSPDFVAAGELGLAMAIYNVFAPAAIYRMYTYQVSDVTGENEVGEYLAFRAITCGLALFALVLYTVVSCQPETWGAIVLFAVSKICSLMVDVLHGQDQLCSRMDYVGRSLTMQGISSLVIFAVVFKFAGSLELCFVVMSLATLLIGALYDYPRTKQFGRVSFGISRKKAFYLIESCLPIVFATIACSAASTFPRQALSQIWGTDSLGIYSSVATIAVIIQACAAYVYNPLLGNLARLHYQGDVRGVKGYIAKIGMGIMAVSVICIAALWFCGPYLLRFVVGTSVDPYAYLLLPAIGSALMIAIVGFLSDVLVSFRCFRGSFIGSVFAFVSSAVVTVPFVRMWGMNGVSFVVIASMCIACIVMAWWLAKELKGLAG